MTRRAQCEVGIDSDGYAGGGVVQFGGSDRCRRRRGHVDGSELGQWHLLDCGGAVTDQGKWSNSWQEIFVWVAESGEWLENWTEST